MALDQAISDGLRPELKAIEEVRDHAIDGMRGWAAAEVKADDLTEAISLVHDALDVLRVFQQTRSQMKTTAFGLPGDVHQARMLYLDLHDDNVGVGFRDNGEVLGSGLPDRELAQWSDSRFDEVADFIGRSDPPDGPGRLVLACRLLARAVFETQPSLRTLETIIAVETLLGGQGKKYLLARRVSFLVCGRVDGQRCGRDGPSCDFLKLNPTSDSDRKRIKAMERDARADPAKRCSEWLDFLDRYDDRCGVAHGEPGFEVPANDADGDLYWAIHWLLPAAIPWLLDHPNQPIDDLDTAISGLAN
jgi:hypothetical protein